MELVQMLEILLTVAVSTAGVLFPAIFWMSDRTRNNNKVTDTRLDVLERDTVAIQLKLEHNRELIETKLANSIEKITKQLDDVQVSIKHIKRHFDEGCKVNGND